MELTANAYIFYFGIPIIVFLVMATNAYKNNTKALEHRLLALSFVLYAALFMSEWVRHLHPLSNSPFMTTWLNGFGMILALSMTMHVCAILYEKHTKTALPFHKSLLYIGLAMHLLISCSPIASTSTDFVKEGIWIRRDAPLYMLWISTFVFTTMIFNVIVCFLAYRKVKHQKQSKQLFLYLVWIIPINTLLFNVIISFIPMKYTPSIPTLYIMVMLSLLLLIGMQKYHLFPQYAKRYMLMFEKSPVCKFILDDGYNITEINKQTDNYFETLPFLGQNFIELLQSTNNYDSVLPFLQQLKENKEIANVSLTLKHYATGEPIHILANASEIEENGNLIFYVMFRDRTVEVEQEEKIRELAFFDSLTCLPNRASFLHECKQMYSTDEDAALLLIDLNDFKIINDRYGHAAGDLVLQRAANVLYRVADTIHFAARLGGDEFVMYVRTEALTEPVESFVSQLRSEMLREEVLFEGARLHINPSIGIALKQPHITFDQFMHEADVAMYLNKEQLKSG